MTPRGHQTSANRALYSYRTRKDLIGLQAYLRGDEFMRHFSGMAPKHRIAVIMAVGKAFNACEERLAPPKRQSTRQWDAARIERLRRVYAGGDGDHQAALALGISLGAAKMARWRYLAAATTQQAA